MMEVDQATLFQPTMPSVLSEVTAMYQPFVEKLFDENTDRVKEGCKEIKDLVIGNNKQKTNFIVLGAVPRLVYLIQDAQTSIDLKSECAIVLGSLAKGIEANVKNLIDYGVVEAMCSSLCSTDLKLYEACLRCLRTIMTSSENTSNFLYVNPEIVMPQILENINKSTCTQICTCEIISHCFQNTEQQNLLLGFGAINNLTSLILMSDIQEVQKNALKSLSVLCYKNAIICQQVADTTVDNKSFVEFLIKTLSKKNSKLKQLYAAKCLSFMFKTEVIELNSYNSVIARKVLPFLIQLCGSSSTTYEKINGAKTVAYLTDDNCSLQRLSFICDQYPLKLEAFFKNPTVGDTKNAEDMLKFKQELKHRVELQSVGFLGYASLLSNDEDIRKQVCSDALVNNIVEALHEVDSKLRRAALRCLLSLTRSVHLLRTFIQDADIGKTVLNLLKAGDRHEKETIVLSGVMANLVLEFCPNKSDLLVANVLQNMCEWTKSENIKIRVNGIWGLMNMAFQADSKLKQAIIESMGFQGINKLLSDENKIIIVRTLGMLRNILSDQTESTTILTKYGYDIIQSCQQVLETFSNYGTGDPNLHEECEIIRMHAVCVLCCVAVGDNATAALPSYIRQNEALLSCIISYLGHFHSGLQKATVKFIYNLARCNEPGATERQDALTRLNILSSLEQLQSTTDSSLYELVKKTLEQFEGQKM